MRAAASAGSRRPLGIEFLKFKVRSPRMARSMVTPNGKWDGATVEAMKKFQDSHGLNPTGKLDAQTLQKLGLGSQTAGIAPPMPPVSSTSLTTSPAAAVPRLP